MPGTLSLGAMVRLLRSTTGMLSLRPAIRHPSMVHVRLRATIHVRHGAVVGAAGDRATIHVRHSAVVGVSRGARHGLPRVSVMRTRPLSKSKRASKDCYDDGYGLVHMR